MNTKIRILSWFFVTRLIIERKSFSISNKILSLYSQIIGLPKIYRKLFDHKWSNFTTGHIRVFWGKIYPKLGVFCQFLSRILLKHFHDKIVLDNNLTYPLKKQFSKNVYNSRYITFPKASSSQFHVSTNLNFFEKVLSILKNSSISILQNVWHDIHVAPK